jgi:hypothetical protein
MAEHSQDPAFQQLDEIKINSASVRSGMPVLLASVLSLILVISFFAYIWRISMSDWEAVFRAHFSTVVGLPFAATFAFVIVQFLSQTKGPVEFEGLSFKFKGAAGQVVMWVLCFLAMVLGIKVLW